jgi:hypothetical protein
MSFLLSPITIAAAIVTGTLFWLLRSIDLLHTKNGGAQVQVQKHWDSRH